MKKVFFTIYIAILLFIALFTGLAILSAYLKEKQNYENWVECIESGSGSDLDCERCDFIFNPEGKDYRMPDN